MTTYQWRPALPRWSRKRVIVVAAGAVLAVALIVLLVLLLTVLASAVAPLVKTLAFLAVIITAVVLIRS